MALWRCCVFLNELVTDSIDRIGTKMNSEERKGCGARIVV